MDIDVVIGCQWGSEAKGLFASYIAAHCDEYDWLISCNTRNAGHTVYTADGTKLVARYLPSGAVTARSARIYIAAGTNIHKETLDAEIAAFESAGVPIRDRLHIDVNAGYHSEEHAVAERESKLDVNLGSTCEGVGEAQVDRVRRQSPRFRDVYSGFNWGRPDMLAGSVLLEISQGYLLSQLSDYYPYCTSRVVSTAAALAYSRLSPRYLRHVYGIFRTFPIRVANRVPKPLDNGRQPFDPTQSSGSMDGLELSWDEVRTIAKASPDQIPTEYTTVTKLPRRIGLFNVRAAKAAIAECGVDRPCLGFINYLDQAAYGAASIEELERASEAATNWIHSVECQLGIEFYLLSTSPHVVFRRQYEPIIPRRY